MKKNKMLAIFFVVVSIGFGIVGCSNLSGSNGSGNGDGTQMPVIPEGFVYVKGTTITGTESWTPSSEVFLSGRKLTIPDLIVSDHEVTIGEYKAVMGRYQGDRYGYDKDGNILNPDNALNLPVNYVTWYIAIEYCNKLSIKENLTPCYSGSGDNITCNWNANGYRLPTEVEWEWLARGGENYIYAGSNTEDDVAWTTDNTNTEGRREIKTKAPNGYGLYDMSGNVYEWCWDWHGNINDTTAADGATWSDTRVRRGGSYCEYIVDCGVATRFKYGSPSDTNCDYGFRVVRQAL